MKRLCTHCVGEGRVLQPLDNRPVKFMVEYKSCPACHGTGLAERRRRMDFTVIHAFPPVELEQAWRSFLTRADFPTHYTAPEFFLEKHLTRLHPFAVLAIGQGGISGVLTGLHESHRTVSGLTVRPQVCLDHCADINSAANALMDGLRAEAGSSDLIEVCSWTPLPAWDASGFQVQSVEGPVVLDLTQSPQTLFRRLDKKRRNNIRYAEKNGVEVSEVRTAEEFRAYYQEVYCHWRATSRKQIFAAETAQEGFEHRFELSGCRKLFVARFEGKMVAGIFLRIQPGGLVEYAAGQSVDEALYLKPNDLVQWKGIEWACGQGFRTYSLGGSGPFHREFGGTVVPVCRYRLDQSWLHRYSLQDVMVGSARKILHVMPKPIQQVVRRLRAS
jgi:hypothetical protein